MRRVLAALLAPLVLAALFGIVAMWPENREHTTPNAFGQSPELTDGKITRVDRRVCEPANVGICMTAYVQLSEGPEKGTETSFLMTEGPGQPDLDEHDAVVLARSTDSTGLVVYSFADFQRTVPLSLLAIAFAVLVVGVARWRGLGALLGLVLTWAIVTQFMLPSILEGNSPTLVALSGGAAIILSVLYVAHGFNARTTTAVIGTLASLAVSGVLAAIAVQAASLSGFSSEEATYIQSFVGTIDIRGLLLAGILLGSLGVLNDMTVTQASAVWEIHAAQPDRGRMALYRSGMRVGRDHIASTVYTLVLAYTGAALPLLLLFSLASRPFGDVITSDLVGEEVVRTLVGSIGIILSVPITTALAAFAASSRTSLRSSD